MLCMEIFRTIIKTRCIVISKYLPLFCIGEIIILNDATWMQNQAQNKWVCLWMWRVNRVSCGTCIPCTTLVHLLEWIEFVTFVTQRCTWYTHSSFKLCLLLCSFVFLFYYVTLTSKSLIWRIYSNDSNLYIL